MTYTIYKSSDPDAPQLTNTAGALKTILKACLITGYGTGADAKAPAGWLMPFEEPDKAVFQPTGNHAENLLLRIAGTARPTLSAYSEMTNIDTGTKAYDFGKGANTTADWFIVATVDWFWFFYKDNDWEAYAPIFFGNLPNIIPENKKKTVAINPTHYGSPSTLAESIFSLDRTLSVKKHSGGNFDLFTGFNPHQKYNVSSSGDMIWLDIIATTEATILGCLPLLKATPVNAGAGSWQEITTGVFALKVNTYHRTSNQIIMDFNDVS